MYYISLFALIYFILNDKRFGFFRYIIFVIHLATHAGKDRELSFSMGVGTFILGGELSILMSTSDMILINVACFISNQELSSHPLLKAH